MMKKLAIVVVVVLLLAGGAYKTVLAKPAEPGPKPKVEGTVYVLPTDFILGLADGRYAKLSVGFVMDPDDTSTVASGGHGAVSPPEGYGTMAQEGIVRDLITDALTGAVHGDLIEAKGRVKLKKRILSAVRRHTDVEADKVLFIDVTVT